MKDEGQNGLVLRGIGALMVVLASGALAGAEPEGCCPVPTLIPLPVTIYIQPQPPGPWWDRR